MVTAMWAEKAAVLCAACEVPATSEVARRGAPALPLCATHRAAFDARLARLELGIAPIESEPDTDGS